MKAVTSSEPDPTDVHVGRRIRAQRLIKGFSQEQLANALGLTFQQVQKYEKGVNRIAPSRLQIAANFLNVDVAWFYQQGPATGVSTAEARDCDFITELLSTSAGARLGAAFVRISSQRARLSLVQLAEALADAEPGQANDAKAA